MPNDNRYHMPIINRDGNLHFYKVLHDSLLAQEDTVYPCTVILGFGTGVPHEIFDFVLQGYYTPIFAICQCKCEKSLFSLFSWIFTFFSENSLFVWKFTFGVKIQSSGVKIWFCENAQFRVGIFVSLIQETTKMKNAGKNLSFLLTKCGFWYIIGVVSAG